MPLNEHSRARRDRWPLEFDLEGIPRDTAVREQLLKEHRSLEIVTPDTETEQNMSPVTNSFAVDHGAGETVLDINNPPRKNYNPNAPENQFPRAVYHHETGRVLHVSNEKELKAALKRDFDLKPSAGRDYSKISAAGIAAPKTVAELREEEMSAEDLAALDEAENE